MNGIYFSWFLFLISLNVEIEFLQGGFPFLIILVEKNLADDTVVAIVISSAIFYPILYKGVSSAPFL